MIWTENSLGPKSMIRLGIVCNVNLHSTNNNKCTCLDIHTDTYPPKYLYLGPLELSNRI
jgi:hypothetical protein